MYLYYLHVRWVEKEERNFEIILVTVVGSYTQDQGWKGNLNIDNNTGQSEEEVQKGKGKNK